MTGEAIDFHGLPAIRWRSADGASAVATLQGAHLVSWVPAGGEEALYLSERSAFVAGRAIRGGIPVIFPQFADRGPLAQHGFARTSEWRFDGVRDTAEGALATFTLESSPATLATWPHAFRIALEATVGGKRLAVVLRVTNPGPAPFAFTAALHTYLRISDAASARLAGLAGLSYLERGASQRRVEEREFVTAAEPIDRIYFGAPGSTHLEDAGRALRISQETFSDTVVWNPGADRTARMADMPPEGWRRMWCVEAAAIEPPILLAPGASWCARQAIAAS